MKEIPLTKGYVTLVDDEDYAWLTQFKWKVQVKPNTAYAIRSAYRSDTGKPTTLQMARAILKVTDRWVFVDHADHNGLNNQKYNLRLSNCVQNQQNVGMSKVNTSGFKGATWDKYKGKWKASITLQGRLKHLGHFDTPKEAGLAYQKAAKLYHKEFFYDTFNGE